MRKEADPDFGDPHGPLCLFETRLDRIEPVAQSGADVDGDADALLIRDDLVGHRSGLVHLAAGDVVGVHRIDEREPPRIDGNLSDHLPI
jgi:hypothetical protein